MSSDRKPLSQKQLHFIADKLMDALNYSIAVAVFNELLSAGKLSVILSGGLTYIVSLGVLTYIQKGK